MFSLRQAMAIAALVGGLSAGSSLVSGALAQSMPEIRVDQEHLQMQAPGSKQLIYEIHQCNGFVVDTTNYIFHERQEHAGHRKVIQVIAGRNQVLSLPLSDSQKRYTVAVAGGFRTGQRLTLGIGYQAEGGPTIKFFPAWIGLVDIK
jgi:hypothetical protein